MCIYLHCDYTVSATLDGPQTWRPLLPYPSGEHANSRLLNSPGLNSFVKKTTFKLIVTICKYCKHVL